ncbi:hypothetical protein CXG81DRAFT_11524 [Caulochytrium protostelioides]|uniref:Nitrogen permease regulator 2 n=1 Tax=Caulochytrium protostelioides TaxID=1555241 RepID=A0A4P9X923_9FUNG|nr:hypothetical protein CXG81DRAFT_11524 [Caulochytrium protostelioides]|eukprot:RKP01827.1 hypothetical protein CXG81DRAFT_11524 [Caulochytrium protostelioides]
MDRFNEFAQVEAMLFCEFHPRSGPVVTYKVPENFGDAFDSISEYLIPKPAFCNRLVTVHTTTHIVMGHAVLIPHEKYERNAMLFNLCFVFALGANVGPYEPVVTKMARLLRAFETESGMLSQPATKATVLTIMEQLQEDLNSYAESQIPINHANAINIKIFPKYPATPPVYDWQVPVCLVDLMTMVDKNWDLTMQRILRYINGVLTVRRIAEEAAVDANLVGIALRHLVNYGCIRMVDLFQFSNVYVLRGNTTAFLAQPALQDQYRRFIALEPAHPPPATRVFTLLCGLRPGLTVKQWMAENGVDVAQVDVRRFFLFGVLHNLIYRLHKFPVTTRGAADGLVRLREHGYGVLRRLIRNHRPYDEICTMLRISARELDDVLALEPGIRFIYAAWDPDQQTGPHHGVAGTHCSPTSAVGLAGAASQSPS